MPNIKSRYNLNLFQTVAIISLYKYLQILRRKIIAPPRIWIYFKAVVIILLYKNRQILLHLNFHLFHTAATIPFLQISANIVQPTRTSIISLYRYLQILRHIIMFIWSGCNYPLYKYLQILCYSLGFSFNAIISQLS